MKKVCFLVLLVFVTFGLSAEEKGFSLSLEPSLGLLSGHGEEIVYRNKDSDDKLSQLLWNMEPLVYAGIELNFKWHKPRNIVGVFTNVSFKFGIPMESGVMEDRDWDGSVGGVWDSNRLTKYSVHDNKTDKALLVSADLGISFKIADKFLLKTFLAYDYMSFAWTASGGSILYPAIDGGHQFLSSNDSVTYKQTWHIVSPAISFSGDFNRYFNAEISLKASPLIWCFAEDNHIMRDLFVTDTMQRGFFIEPKLVFSFTPKDFFELSLSVSYRNISRTRGDADYDYSDGTSDFTAKDMAGAGYSAFDVGLIAKFRVLNK